MPASPVVVVGIEVAVVVGEPRTASAGGEADHARDEQDAEGGAGEPGDGVGAATRAAGAV